MRGAARTWAVSSALVLSVWGAVPLPARADDIDDLHVRYLIAFATQLADTERAKMRAGAARICLIGSDSISQALEASAQDVTREGRAIEAGTVRTVDQARACQILFIARSEAANVERILQQVGRNVLTVSALPGFVQRGGMVQLQVDGEGVGYKTSPRGYELVGGTPRDLLGASACTRRTQPPERDPGSVTDARTARIPTTKRRTCIDEVRQQRREAELVRATRTPRPPVPDEPDEPALPQVPPAQPRTVPPRTGGAR